MEELMEERIARRLRSLRQERRITQVALAQEAGLAQSVISALENATFRNPGLQTLSRIADALCIPVEQLWQDAPQPAIDIPPTPLPDGALRTALA